jgi:hypothetical protein
LNAYSGNPTCVGKISGVSVSESGGVYASIKNGNSVNLTDVQFCNLNDTSSSYSGTACKGLLSLLMSGAAMDNTATLWFREAKFTSCTANWSNIKDFGFYHFKLN